MCIRDRSGALRKRGELDQNGALVKFAEALERASIRTIEEGVMTKDLALLWEKDDKTVVDTHGFICEIAKRLDEELKEAL